MKRKKLKQIAVTISVMATTLFLTGCSLSKAVAGVHDGVTEAIEQIEENRKKLKNTEASLDVNDLQNLADSIRNEAVEMAQKDSYGERNGIKLYMTRACSKEAKGKAQEIVKVLQQSSGQSQYELVKAIHDYLVENVHYDYEGGVELHTADGPLLYGKSVCEGYANAFNLLCYYAGIQGEMVTGNATNENGTASHAWNMVEVDGIWYLIDVTWDDPYNVDTLLYDYFLVSENVMNLSHEPTEYSNYHPCNDERYLESNERYTAENNDRRVFEQQYAGEECMMVNTYDEMCETYSTYAQNRQNIVIGYHNATVMTSNEEITARMEELQSVLYEHAQKVNVACHFYYAAGGSPCSNIYVKAEFDSQ